MRAITIPKHEANTTMNQNEMSIFVEFIFFITFHKIKKMLNGR